MKICCAVRFLHIQNLAQLRVFFVSLPLHLLCDLCDIRKGSVLWRSCFPARRASAKKTNTILRSCHVRSSHGLLKHLQNERLRRILALTGLSRCTPAPLTVGEALLNPLRANGIQRIQELILQSKALLRNEAKNNYAVQKFKHRFLTRNGALGYVSCLPLLLCSSSLDNPLPHSRDSSGICLFSCLTEHAVSEYLSITNSPLSFGYLIARTCSKSQHSLCFVVLWCCLKQRFGRHLMTQSLVAQLLETNLRCAWDQAMGARGGHVSWRCAKRKSRRVRWEMKQTEMRKYQMRWDQELKWDEMRYT